MNIERGILARQGRPYPNTPTLSLTPPLDFGDPILSTEQRKGEIKIEFIGSENFPKTLTLWAKIEPISLKNRNCFAQITVNQKAFKPVSYYDPLSVNPSDQMLARCSLYEAIDLKYLGYGSFEEQYFQGEDFQDIQLILPPEKILFRKNFNFQTVPFLSQSQELNQEGEWIVTPPLGRSGNIIPLYTYGGLYREGISIEKIVSVMSVLTYQGEVTDIRLFSLMALEQDKIIPPKGGIKGNVYWYFFDELTPDQEISLGSSLKQKRAQITLKHALTQETMDYSSISYQQTDIKSGTVEIIFCPLKTNERKENASYLSM